MKENRLMPICVLTLSAAVIFGSVWIGNSIRNNATNLTNLIKLSNTASYSKALMTDKETSEYLNLSLEKFEKLVIQSDIQRKQVSSYDTFRYIQHITIDGVRYFNKEHIDKWVEYNSLRSQEIETNLK